MMKRVVQGAVVLGVAIMAWFIYKTGALEQVLMMIEAAGFWGPLIFLAVFALACIFFVPFGIFAFCGGMLFGFWRGSALRPRSERPPLRPVCRRRIWFPLRRRKRRRRSRSGRPRRRQASAV